MNNYTNINYNPYEKYVYYPPFQGMDSYSTVWIPMTFQSNNS